MPASLVCDDAIPQLAAQIDSPALLRVLQNLRQTGFILNTPSLDPETAASLQYLAALGLADPGYEGPTNGKPLLWVSNPNGERVLKYFEAVRDRKLTVHPRARTALESLPETDRQAVQAAVAALLIQNPASWPREQAVRLNPDQPVYLLRVSPELRAFLRVLDADALELLDIVREETLRLFVERYRAGSSV